MVNSIPSITNDYQTTTTVGVLSGHQTARSKARIYWSNSVTNYARYTVLEAILSTSDHPAAKLLY